jgi:dTDP-4-dehydrorhamnose reductase
MRLLVTGGGGQLATDLARVATAAGDNVVAPGRAQLDVCNRDSVLAAITSWRPDVVVNAAAWTAVDACESDPDRADLTNGLAVRWLAEAVDGIGAHLVQMSTDYVFDGTLDRPYHEADATGPRSAYGRSKLMGEHEALALGTRASVVRTSWVCGEHGSNMVKAILRLASEPGPLRFVDDQVGHPTFTHDLAIALRRVAIDRISGVVHATNHGAVSWFEFAQAVLLAAGYDPSRVEPIATADLQPPRPAPRPANSVLDNRVLRAVGHPPMRDFREPLAEVVSALLGGDGTSR